MIHVILVLFLFGCIQLFSEILLRKKYLGNETARKLIHITGGTVAAFLPFWISYNWIALLSAVALLLGLINRRKYFFKAGLSVKRHSYGDLFLGLAILFCSLVHPAPWIFAVAILHVALADGYAAIVGIKFGKRNYIVMGHKKSIVGTATFAAISFAILLIAYRIEHLQFTITVLASLLIIPTVTAILENISGYGSDNFTVPTAVLALLAIFRF